MNWKQVKSIKIKEGDVKSLSINSQVVWSKGEVPPEPPVEDHRFRFYNPGEVVNTLSNSGSPSFETSTDGVNWTPDAVFTSVDIQPKSTLYLRGKNATMENKTFSSTQPIECHGSVMDLIDSGTGTTTLPSTYWIFSKLFYNMYNLLTPPELPAKKLSMGCYNSMFYGCRSMMTTPMLPATTLSQYCYGKMFRGCRSMMTTPDLPATTLADNCYDEMFRGCTSLTSTPELPATEPAPWCYRSMFSDCTSLVNIPKIMLKVKNYRQACESMFARCTSITTVSDVIVEEFGYDDIYDYMFYDCSNLKYVKVSTTKWNVDSTTNWLGSVSSTGTFVKPAELVTWDGTGTQPEGSIPLNSPNGIPSGWTVEDINPKPVEDHRFRFYNPGDVDCELKNTGSGKDFQTSTDGINWTPVASFYSVNIPAKSTLYMKGSNPHGLNGFIFNSTQPLECHGSVMDLVDGGASTLEIPWNNSFKGLFQFMGTLLTAPELPATTLKDSCYESMFSGTSIIEPPKLPATTINRFSYSNMFGYCKKLTTAPELPATILGYEGYRSMFSGCESLTKAPELPKITSFGSNCLQFMFYDCKNLSYIKVNSEIKQSDRWVMGVSSTGTFVKPTDVSISTGQNGIPSGWTVEEF